VDVTETVNVTVVLVLVAWTLSTCLAASYSASVMATLSAGTTVSPADLVAPPRLAEMVTVVVVAETCAVATVNVALEAPAGTVTLAGTEAMAGLLLLRLMPTPPAGAAPVSVTVPCDPLPAVTLVGLRLSEPRLAEAVALGVNRAALAVGITLLFASVVIPPATSTRPSVSRVAEKGLSWMAGKAPVAIQVPVG